ncbi:helix-turn-helix domain-containing protein, partial [Escherichia coli]|nr:helix-turn-helix domain-containing protein [Escherichia coli O157:H7]EFI6577357.1 helix-turn-helix domain-containing protein [Escherichia coli]
SGSLVSRIPGAVQVPSERVLQLCELGNWSVTPHELRPDIYPNPNDGLPECYSKVSGSTA